MSFKIGIGFDNHFLKSKKNNIIKLGGIDVQCDYEIIAHSDGDVILHSISDALLGAAGLGDIGMYFSDKDPKNKNLNSKNIIEKVLKMINNNNYEIVNIDINIFAESIKINPIRNLLIKNLQKYLSIKNVNIKAKHYEEPKLELACQSIVLLKSKS